MHVFHQQHKLIIFLKHHALEFWCWQHQWCSDSILVLTIIATINLSIVWKLSI